MKKAKQKRHSLSIDHYYVFRCLVYIHIVEHVHVHVVSRSVNTFEPSSSTDFFNSVLSNSFSFLIWVIFSLARWRLPWYFATCASRLSSYNNTEQTINNYYTICIIIIARPRDSNRLLHVRYKCIIISSVTYMYMYVYTCMCTYVRAGVNIFHCWENTLIFNSNPLVNIAVNYYHTCRKKHESKKVSTIDSQETPWTIEFVGKGARWW